MTPEGKVKNKVKALLKKYDAYQHWPVQTGYGAACLDCHGCYKGLYYAVETKAPGKRPTPRQVISIEDIENAGGKVFVIGERVVHRKGDVIFDRFTDRRWTTLSDIYSGEQELKYWLEDERCS
jgi:hypothetical protein